MIEKRASIDIGSNSVILLIGNYNDSSKEFNKIFEKIEVTNLGKNLSQGYFSSEAMNKTFNVLKDYKDRILAEGVLLENLIIVATEASRIAKNAVNFFLEIKNKLGFSIKIINGEGEAFYTTLGLIQNNNIKSEKLIIMDMGGASTELISLSINPFQIEKTISMPLGSRRVSDWEIENKREKKVQEILSKEIFDDFQIKELYCVSGTMTSLASMILDLDDFEEEKIDGLKISRHDYADYLLSIKEFKPK